jgi:branched-chain amino acid transport system permease protein
VPDFIANFLQLTLDGIVNGSLYAMLGIGFGLILGVSGRFHIAFVSTYVVSAYVAAGVTNVYGWPFWLAMIVGGIAAAIVGMLMEVGVYGFIAKKAVRAGGNPLLMIFVASLGLSIFTTNLLAAVTLNQASLTIGSFDDASYNVGPIVVTKLSLIIIGVGILLVALYQLVLSYTTLGRMIRAVRANPDMALCVGIEPARMYLVVFAMGSFIGGVSAVLHGEQTSANVQMGLTPFFYALVVAFVSGLTASPLRVGTIALILGLIESWSALYLPTAIKGLVVFVILFVYVAMRPVRMQDLRKRFSRPKPATPARAGA